MPAATVEQLAMAAPLIGQSSRRTAQPPSSDADAAGRIPIDVSQVHAARNGDRAAFARVHQAFAPMVHGILLARVSRDDADDLTQEVFLHAMRRLSSLADASAIGPWLAAIARNLAATLHRAPRLNVQELANRRTARDQTNDEVAQAMIILEAIRQLPEAYAETLVLRLVEGMTGPQIAACTGLSPGSVRVNLHRGMHMLRDRLASRPAGGIEP